MLGKPKPNLATAGTYLHVVVSQVTETSLFSDLSRLHSVE